MIGLIIYGVKVCALKVPGQKATDIAVVLYAVPGALIGIAAVYLEGMRRNASESASRLCPIARGRAHAFAS